MSPLPEKTAPAHVVLFSGHMIDARGREKGKVRFPADKEPVAANAIGRALDEIGVGSGDVGLCGGACGGDLLFAEAMLAREARVELRIPFPEDLFLLKSVEFEKSVTTIPDRWRTRYLAVKGHPRTQVFVLPPEIETESGSLSRYERNNLWQLESAYSYGPEKVQFVCLWNGEKGDGPGGTAHMYAEVRKRSGASHTHWLDTRSLW